MPIRRRDDGEIVEEDTELLKSSNKGAGSSATDVPTDPIKSRGSGDVDSLFEPRQRVDDRKARLEEPTVPVGSDLQRDKGSTRIVSPHLRKPSAASAAVREDPMLDPPVGWLVIVRGPGKGHVLTLGNGMNVMGRSSDSRVCIDFGDDTIARANHARLVYEPRQRRYLLNHGDGSNLTYLNNDVVTESVGVKSGAMIEVGETTLRFQAFCSKDFDWPDVDD